MKSNRCLFLIFVGWIILTGAVNADPAAAPKPIDGEVTAQQIRAKLQSEGFSELTKITVEADDDGEVSLKCMAASDAEAERVVELARSTNGVMAVRSEIMVKRLQ